MLYCLALCLRRYHRMSSPDIVVDMPIAAARAAAEIERLFKALTTDEVDAPALLLPERCHLVAAYAAGPCRYRRSF
jgi:hypothetical protein